ncbi:hypothetical protein AVEN_182698-1 [Araneus ventricosus]|uniref:Uncharacterized protein n=1 Tax=Araneus ventricosus TaxID=182803 RepID=A0A4Y2JSD9_ARAVE|nr:hypothetical protein AVEN_182698-1 [Araneus ventricosus]
MNWTLPTLVVIYNPTPAITFPEDARKWAAVCKDNWTSLPRLSPKRPQNLTSPEKKPTVSDRPSSMLKKNFQAARDRLARSQRVKLGLEL